MRIMGNEVSLPESPGAKLLAWAIGIGGGTLVAWLFLDGYFLHAAAGAEMKKDYREQIAATNAAVASRLDATNLQVEYSADQNAKRMIDNQLFQLEQIPVQQLRPQDRALYQKLQRDRSELVDLWIRRGRPLR